ncbi:alpha-L-fucosidase [Pontibacter sp. 13R65]|uniref:alpha-L-fucosidase n=1 Tax=Pontibacter sp. 13R65 TaxID=3127458 RepID=UPI00301BD1CC
MINSVICKAMLLFLVFSFSSEKLMAQKYQPKWSSLDQRPVPQWWSDAKFGIFVHWGLYSVPAYAPVNEVEGVYEKYAEHYMNRLLEGNPHFTNYQKKFYGEGSTYRDFVPLFKAEYFEPDQWAEMFKKSGAGYVVLTSKHHDGYCLWPSKLSPGWNSVETGPRRDLINELSNSVRKAGLRMGLYYSLLEWDNPLYSAATIDQWTTQHMIPQMKDLVSRYKPEVIFADGEWDFTSAELRSEEFLAWLYNESPVKSSVVVNDRWGKETRSKHGGYYTTEYDLIGDEVNTSRIEHPWEESRGIGTSYGFNQFETLEHYSSSKELIHLLINKVSNGGNLLLNVGPQANGLIPVIMEQRLLDIGSWLKINGEAIYGTSAWGNRPNNMQETGVFYTQKGNDLYVICTKWPQAPLNINISKTDKVSLLGSPAKVSFKVSKNKLTITPPAINPGNAPGEHAWVFKVENFK